MFLSRRQLSSVDGGRTRRTRPSGVELGRRLKDLPSAQSGPIPLVLAASGLVSVGLEIVAAVSYARAVRRAYSARQLGIRPAILEPFTTRLLALSGVHLSYKLYLKFLLVRWVERAVHLAERRSGRSPAPDQW